jgi:uncharacterized protein YcfJ
MKPAHALLVLACTLAAAASPAAQAATSDNAVVHGVKLKSVCDGCGVVSGVRSETRKGEGSGLGAVGGAVVGGVVGHQFGGGGGKTALTVAGAAAGGLAGHEIEKNMKKHTVWITTVTLKDGSKHSYERGQNPGLKAGDVVRVENGQPVKVAAR